MPFGLGALEWTVAGVSCVCGAFAVSQRSRYLLVYGLEYNCTFHIFEANKPSTKTNGSATTDTEHTCTHTWRSTSSSQRTPGRWIPCPRPAGPQKRAPQRAPNYVPIGSHLRAFRPTLRVRCIFRLCPPIEPRPKCGLPAEEAGGGGSRGGAAAVVSGGGGGARGSGG